MSNYSEHSRGHFELSGRPQRSDNIDKQDRKNLSPHGVMGDPLSSQQGASPMRGGVIPTLEGSGQQQSKSPLVYRCTGLFHVTRASRIPQVTGRVQKLHGVEGTVASCNPSGDTEH